MAKGKETVKPKILDDLTDTENPAPATEPVAEPVVEKPIVPVEVTTLQSGTMSLQPYNPNAIAEFGNAFAYSLVMQAGLEEEAQKALAQAGEAKQFLSFEMTKAILDMYYKYEEDPKHAIDVYGVFGEAKDVEKLNTKVLINFGVLRREINDNDEVEYIWTDERVKSLYSYTKALKDKNADEYTRRFNNRKRLNARLSDAYKAVAGLLDNNLSPDDLFYSEDESGSLVPTIKNAPKDIGGDKGIVQFGAKKPVAGAKLSPTMSSLVKLATEKHKPKSDRTDKGENREGDTPMGMSDEDFGGIVNTLRRAINHQEGKFSDDMKKQLKALQDFLNPVVVSFG